jgi:uroporphyrin-III C-methyltransferase
MRTRDRDADRVRERDIVRPAPPFVSFVGAGPGDPELITVKGLRRLRAAAVILCDRLAPRELLAEAPPAARVIDVGKARGRAGYSQSAINHKLVESARCHGPVVRLKGGDPSIFGRLAEEIEAVRAAGIALEIIPGVTAATAAAARAGVSLTARGCSSLVVLATATDQTGCAPPDVDWEALARLDGTLVFYMTARALEAISGHLIALGRDAGEPAVAIERVGMSGERSAMARLGDIAEAARAAGIAAPAVLITGPTVAAATPSMPAALRHVLAGLGT